MDHRSGLASPGTSPLKAAGFLVGLLVVVALAFALGMKAGRELDVLRPDREGATVKLADAKPDPKPKTTPDAGASARRDDATVKPADPAGPKAVASDGTGARHDVRPPVAHEEAGGATAASTALVGDEPVQGAAPAAAPAERAGGPSAGPTPDYTIFSKAPGAAKPGAAGSSLDTPPAAELASKPTTARAAEPTKPAKDPSARPDPKIAAAKPTPAPTPKPATPPASQGQLKITPEAQGTSDKASPGFVVQVAALQSKADADQLATRLRAHGTAPYINKVELPNGTWYRVRVGKYKTTAEAKAAQKKLAGAGFRGAEVMSAR